MAPWVEVNFQEAGLMTHSCVNLNTVAEISHESDGSWFVFRDGRRKFAPKCWYRVLTGGVLSAAEGRLDKWNPLGESDVPAPGV